MATINTNIASINAQRNLALSGQSLNTTMQRLSSGLRVNSAKDDAAGLAISERMLTQVKGLTVASRNANDGISLAQTAEGALGKVGDMFQRMRELAVQAGNASNSASDRAALQQEVKQLADEVDRVAKQTNFNGQKVLDGSFLGAVFQVGANSGDNITLGALVDTRADRISKIDYSTGTEVIDVSDKPIPAIADYNLPIAAGTLSITVVGHTTITLDAIPAAQSSSERLGQVVEAINKKTADTGVTAYLTPIPGTNEYTVAVMSDKLDANQIPLDVTFNGFSADTTGVRGTWEPTPASYMTALSSAAAGNPFVLSSFAEMLEKVLSKNPELTSENMASGEFAAYVATSDQANALALTTALGVANSHIPDVLAARKAFLDADPTTNALAQAYANELGAHFGIVMTVPTGADGLAWTDDEKRAAIDAFAVAQSGITWAGDLSLDITNQQINQRGVDDVDVSTQEGAWVALKKIDNAIDQINSARATLGAIQTRFETAVNNIDIQVENLSAARGRIVDADFAKETANLARVQILQQAGMAMVAQANQIPQNVLQLLQG
ncbi:Uncharacterised protein [uncultured Comamonas sp.]|nr:Uncharacterised protein [uncultured Comamonas sp.]